MSENATKLPVMPGGEQHRNHGCDEAATVEEEQNSKFTGFIHRDTRGKSPNDK